MEWTDVYPKKKGFYWAYLDCGRAYIIKRSGKTSNWMFGGESISSKKISKWGTLVEMPFDGWTRTEPVVEGWFSVEHDDKTKSIVWVALGERLHCYDFEIPSEIDLKKVVLWNGPLNIPSPPAR